MSNFAFPATVRNLQVYIFFIYLKKNPQLLSRQPNTNAYVGINLFLL